MRDPKKIQAIRKNKNKWKNCVVKGELAGLKLMFSKHDEELATGMLVEDETDWVTIVCFPDVYKSYKHLLEVGNHLQIQGRFLCGHGGIKLDVHKIELVS